MVHLFDLCRSVGTPRKICFHCSTSDAFSALLEKEVEKRNYNNEITLNEYLDSLATVILVSIGRKISNSASCLLKTYLIPAFIDISYS